MTKKKNNLISIIPAFLLMGAAVGIQTKNIILHSVIGLIAGIVVYFFLRHRNNKMRNLNK